MAIWRRSNAQLDNRILQYLELGIDIVHQVGDLGLGVEHLHALCVGIVAHSEGTRNRVGEFTKSKLRFEKNSELI